jgi:hypothetical protein
VTKQQVLYLWLAEGALDMQVIAWAFHDGTGDKAPGIPGGDPPYPTGVQALEDGWMLLQSPPPPLVEEGREHQPSYLQHEFVFERRVDVS